MRNDVRAGATCHLFAIILSIALTAYGQQQKRIAIVNTEDDEEPPIKNSELTYLTDRLREIANKTLPKENYTIMTQQSIVAFLGSQESMVKECRAAEGCLAKLGKKINADYVGQGRIGRFGKDLTIKVELYESGSGDLVNSFTGKSKDIYGLLSVLDKEAPDLFKQMPGVSGGSTASFSIEGIKAYYAKGDYDRVIEECNAALRIKHDNREALNWRGNAYYAKGNYDRAIEDYNAVLRIKPDDYQALLNRGNAYYAKGNYDRAIEDYNAVLRIKPDDAYAREGLELVRKKKAGVAQKLDQEQSFTDERTCDSEQKKMWSIVDKCKKIGRDGKGYDTCVSNAKAQKEKAGQVCEDEKTKTAQANRLGDVSSPEQLEKAILELEQVSKKLKCREKNVNNRSSNCSNVLQQWGQMLFKLEALRSENLHEGSLPIFLDYLEFFPDGPSAANTFFQASFILETRGKEDEALKLRQKMVEKYPNHTLTPAAWLRIGEYYFNKSKWSAAIKAYEKITSSTYINKKEAGYAMFHLAEAYYNMANYKLAAQKFSEYIDGADKGKYIKDLNDEAMEFKNKAENMQRRQGNN